VPPKILDRHYKIGSITDHRAKFHADGPRISEISRVEKKINKTSAVKHKSFRKLSFSGGLTNLKRTSCTCILNMGRLTLQGMEFAKKENGSKMVDFSKVWNLQETENARKDKVESARKRN